MGKFSEQPKYGYMDYWVFQKDSYKHPTPEMNLVSYSNEVECELVIDTPQKIAAPQVVYIQPMNQAETRQEKSFFGDNDLIAIGIIVSAAVMLIIHFTGNSQIGQQIDRMEKYKLAQQERQERLLQQDRAYELTRQEQYQQYQLAWKGLQNQDAQQTQQYQIAQQDKQNQQYQQNQQFQLTQQTQLGQLAQQDRRINLEQDNMNKKYMLLKQAQDASSSTTTNIRLGMNF